jgi:hypothetical protein
MTGKDFGRSIGAIFGGFLIGLVTKNWEWLPATVFIILMLASYAYLFCGPKRER